MPRPGAAVSGYTWLCTISALLSGSTATPASDSASCSVSAAARNHARHNHGTAPRTSRDLKRGDGDDAEEARRDLLSFVDRPPPARVLAPRARPRAPAHRAWRTQDRRGTSIAMRLQSMSAVAATAAAAARSDADEPLRTAVALVAAPTMATRIFLIERDIIDVAAVRHDRRRYLLCQGLETDACAALVVVDAGASPLCMKATACQTHRSVHPWVLGSVKSTSCSTWCGSARRLTRVGTGYHHGRWQRNPAPEPVRLGVAPGCHE